MDIQSFVPAQLSDREFRAIYRLSERIRSERRPEESPLLFENFRANLLNIPVMAEMTFWAVWNDTKDEAIARSSVGLLLMEGTVDLGHVDLMVLPEWRRQGIATALLQLMCEKMRKAGRRLLMMESSSTVPAAEAFLRRIGAKSAIQGQEWLLEPAAVDRDLMRRWIEKAKERASGFALSFWESGYPEDRIEEVAVMLDAYNTQPMGDLEIENMHFSAEQVRALDANDRARGVTRWTAIVEEEATGAIAGFTELSIQNNQPEKLSQGLTAVFAPYRNRGLGRWLKAAMVEKVLAELPEARVILTDNASENAAMLGINHEMGFRAGRGNALWQVTVDTVEEYLARRKT